VWLKVFFGSFAVQWSHLGCLLVLVVCVGLDMYGPRPDGKRFLTASGLNAAMYPACRAWPAAPMEIRACAPHHLVGL